MNNTRHRFAILFLLSSFLLPPSSFLLAQVPALINYQGRLLSGTNLVNGNVGLSLRLFNVASGGTSLYEDSNTVTVVDGLYATFIGDHPTNDAFVVALTNPAVWVEVAVNGVALSPRERLASVGYALATRGLRVMTSGSLVVNPEVNSVADGVPYTTIAGGVSNQVFITASNAFIGSGSGNLIGEGAREGVIGGGRNNTIGTNSFQGVIGGGQSNTIDSNTFQTVIGGGLGNDILRGALRSFIGAGSGNTIGTNAGLSVIGGGGSNTVLSDDSVIGGGFDNSISTNARRSVIAGGVFLDIHQGSSESAIAGGRLNTIGTNAPFSIILGGRENDIGTYATNALAAGRRAKANHRGAFVWGDNTNADVASTTNNEVTFRASGGFRVLNGEMQAQAGLRVGPTGTSFERFQAGTAVLGTGINVAVYSVAFSNAFTTVPRVLVTPRGDPAFSFNDTFVATVRSVTTTNFVVNVVRVDSSAPWAQQLRADWFAWE